MIKGRFFPVAFLALVALALVALGGGTSPARADAILTSGTLYDNHYGNTYYAKGSTNHYETTSSSSITAPLTSYGPVLDSYASPDANFELTTTQHGSMSLLLDPLGFTSLSAAASSSGTNYNDGTVATASQQYGQMDVYGTFYLATPHDFILHLEALASITGTATGAGGYYNVGYAFLYSHDTGMVGSVTSEYNEGLVTYAIISGVLPAGFYDYEAITYQHSTIDGGYFGNAGFGNITTSGSSSIILTLTEAVPAAAAVPEPASMILGLVLNQANPEGFGGRNS